MNYAQAITDLYHARVDVANSMEDVDFYDSCVIVLHSMNDGTIVDPKFERNRLYISLLSPPKQHQIEITLP